MSEDESDLYFRQRADALRAASVKNPHQPELIAHAEIMDRLAEKARRIDLDRQERDLRQLLTRRKNGFP